MTVRTVNNHISGVELVDVEEFSAWHKAKPLFKNYTISFFLPFSLQVKFLSGDDTLDHALNGNLAALASLDNVVDYREHCGHDLLTVAAYAGHLELVKFLHQKGIPLQRESPAALTPLLAAAGQNHLSVVSWLVEKGVDVNASNKDGTNVMHVVAFDGSTELLKCLCKNGALVNSEDKEGRTALMAACQTGQHDIVQVLLAYKASIKISAKCGKSASHYAAVTGHYKCLALLLDADESLLNCYDDEDCNLLCVAAYHGNLEVVEVLSDAGADLNAQDHYGRTALMAACEAGHTHIAEYLIAHNALLSSHSVSGISAFDIALLDENSELAEILARILDVDYKDSMGNTPLILACRYSMLPLVNLIMQRMMQDNNLNLQNNLGVSALLASCMSNNCELTRNLLDNGADFNMRSRSGLNAYQIAFLSKSCSLVEMLEVYFNSSLQQLHQCMVLPAAALGDPEVLKQLHQKGCDVNNASPFGVRPLMLAAYHGNRDIASYLIQNNAGIDDRNRQGLSAVAYAIEGKQHKMVDFLIGHGANLNFSNLFGKSLCHMAVQKRNMELLKTITSLGIDINHKDRQGLTPLMLASRNGWLDMVQFLVQRNADITMKCRNGHDASTLASMNNHEGIYQYLKEQTPITMPQFRFKSRYIDPLFRKHDLPTFNACITGNLERLIEEHGKGFYVNSYSKQGLTGLHYASYHGQEDIVKWLLDHGAIPNSYGVEKWTPLMLACLSGREGTVRLLAEHKCLLNLRDTNANTALLYTTDAGHINVLKRLLTLGVLVDMANPDHLTALSHACLNGWLQQVTLLIQYGVEINRRDALGRTPLMAAARKGHTDVVRYLMEQGADISLTCGEGKSALSYAREQGHTKTCDLIKSVATDRGIQLQEMEEDGEREKIQASSNSLVEPEDTSAAVFVHEGEWPVSDRTLVFSDSDEEDELHSTNQRFLTMCDDGAELQVFQELLDEPDLDINVRNSNGQTGLILATKEEYYVLAKTLMQRGAEIDCRDADGRTALMHAVIEDNMPLVRLLVEEAGADLDILDNQGNHMISVASDEGHDEILIYLLEQRDAASARIEASRGELLNKCVQGELHEVEAVFKNSQRIPSGELGVCLSYAAASTDIPLLTMLSKNCNLAEFIVLLSKQCIDQHNERSVDILLDSYSPSVDELRMLLSILCSDSHVGIMKTLCSKMPLPSRSLNELCRKVLVQALENGQYKLALAIDFKWIDFTDKPGAGKYTDGARKKQQARVLYSYTADNDDELELKLGDLVEVTDTLDGQGWWRGTINGKDGIFPSNYVDVVSDNEEDNVTLTSSNQPEEELCFYYRAGRNVNISSDGRFATRQNSYSNAIIMSNRPMRDNELFEVTILQTVDTYVGSIEAGVSLSRKVLDLSGMITDIPRGIWSLSGSVVTGDGVCVTKHYKLHLYELKVGSRIGMARCSDATLHFYLDGEDMGVACTNVPYNVYGVVNLYGQCAQVTLTPGQHFVDQSGIPPAAHASRGTRPGPITQSDPPEVSATEPCGGGGSFKLSPKDYISPPGAPFCSGLSFCFFTTKNPDSGHGYYEFLNTIIL